MRIASAQTREIRRMHEKRIRRGKDSRRGQDNDEKRTNRKGIIRVSKWVGDKKKACYEDIKRQKRASLQSCNQYIKIRLWSTWNSIFILYIWHSATTSFPTPTPYPLGYFIILMLYYCNQKLFYYDRNLVSAVSHSFSFIFLSNLSFIVCFQFVNFLHIIFCIFFFLEHISIPRFSFLFSKSWFSQSTCRPISHEQVM